LRASSRFSVAAAGWPAVATVATAAALAMPAPYRKKRRPSAGAAPALSSFLVPMCLVLLV
jgi:hypothetical protein